MFASCLYEGFACAVWSDGGVVFDESRPNVNYWEPWYLGLDPEQQRAPGVPKQENPRTGAYKNLVASGHDLHELHALMAPRPFLVSGGSEDPPSRWAVLNHAVAINELLGQTNRVAMTNRRTIHPPLNRTSCCISGLNIFWVIGINPERVMVLRRERCNPFRVYSVSFRFTQGSSRNSQPWAKLIRIPLGFSKSQVIKIR